MSNDHQLNLQGPLRRGPCCGCNGTNARCKFCACVKAKRACTNCRLVKNGCCPNANLDFPLPVATSSQPISPTRFKRKHTERVVLLLEFFSNFLRRLVTSRIHTVCPLHCGWAVKMFEHFWIYVQQICMRELFHPDALLFAISNFTVLERTLLLSAKHD